VLEENEHGGRPGRQRLRSSPQLFLDTARTRTRRPRDREHPGQQLTEVLVPTDRGLDQRVVGILLYDEHVQDPDRVMSREPIDLGQDPTGGAVSRRETHREQLEWSEHGTHLRTGRCPRTLATSTRNDQHLDQDRDPASVERYVWERTLADARAGQSGDLETQRRHAGLVPRVSVRLSGYAEVTAQA
jgi:hypothetical protein